ncbi:unnamed protein product, partial [Owenia fusiformis]
VLFQKLCKLEYFRSGTDSQFRIERLMDLVNRSYFYKVDNIQGWGYRHYFAYYSEFQRSSMTIKAVETFFLFLIFTSAQLGNMLTLLTVVRNKPLRTTTNIFIANLAIAGNLFTLWIPLIAITRVKESWVFGDFVCGLVHYVEYVCGVSSIFTVVLISFDRYKNVVMYHEKQWSTDRAVIYIIVIWIVCIVVFFPSGLYFYVEEFPLNEQTVKICTQVLPKVTVNLSYIFMIPVVLLGFCLPAFLISFNYFRIFRTLWRSRNKMSSNPSLASLSTALDTSATTDLAASRGKPGVGNLHSTRNQRDFKVIRRLLYVVVPFILLWAPVFACLLLILHDEVTERFTLSSQFYLFSMCVAYVNASMNPLFYCLKNENFHKGIRNVLTWIMPVSVWSWCTTRGQCDDFMDNCIEGVMNRCIKTGEQRKKYVPRPPSNQEL